MCCFAFISRRHRTACKPAGSGTRVPAARRTSPSRVLPSRCRSTSASSQRASRRPFAGGTAGSKLTTRTAHRDTCLNYKIFSPIKVVSAPNCSVCVCACACESRIVRERYTYTRQSRLLRATNRYTRYASGEVARVACRAGRYRSARLRRARPGPGGRVARLHCFASHQSNQPRAVQAEVHALADRHGGGVAPRRSFHTRSRQPRGGLKVPPGRRPPCALPPLLSSQTGRCRQRAGQGGPAAVRHRSSRPTMPSPRVRL